MAVEIFTKQQFEAAALPVNKNTGNNLWRYLGIRGGEHAYIVLLPNHNIGIEVRSSVKEDGYSADSGKDSIRCWLVDSETGAPMGSKISRWTTRVPGWADRTKSVLRQLWKIGVRLVPCPTCGNKEPLDNRLRCFKVKKEGPNKGKLFLKCMLEGCKHFEWLNEDEEGKV